HRHLESVHPDAMHRLFLVAARPATHEEITGGDQDTCRLGDWFSRLHRIGSGGHRGIRKARRRKPPATRTKRTKRQRKERRRGGYRQRDEKLAKPASPVPTGKNNKNPRDVLGGTYINLSCLATCRMVITQA